MRRRGVLGNFPPACAARAERMTRLCGDRDRSKRGVELRPQPLAGVATAAALTLTLPTRPRLRCASAFAAAFRASLRPHLVPQALCFSFSRSSAERFRSSQLPTPLSPDLSAAQPSPLLEGLSGLCPVRAWWRRTSPTAPQRKSPKLAHQGERLSFVAASAALSPRKAKGGSQRQRRVTSGCM